MHPVVLGNEFNDREASGLHSYQHEVREKGGEVGARFALRAGVAGCRRARECIGDVMKRKGGEEMR